MVQRLARSFDTNKQTDILLLYYKDKEPLGPGHSFRIWPIFDSNWQINLFVKLLFALEFNIVYKFSRPGVVKVIYGYHRIIENNRHSQNTIYGYHRAGYHRVI